MSHYPTAAAVAERRSSDRLRKVEKALLKGEDSVAIVLRKLGVLAVDLRPLHQ
jgi:hypothetical protein